MREVEIDLLDPNIRVAVNDLRMIFEFKKNRLVYTDVSQSKASSLLVRLCNMLGIFDRGITNEKRIISEELSYIDKRTGKTVNFVNSIDNRVRGVLDNNNMYTCLKALALSNKCAHAFDRGIKSKAAIIIDTFNSYYSPEISNHITFFKPFNEIFPDINVNNLYNVSKINKINDLVKDIKRIKKDVGRASKKQKTGILNLLGIKFDYIDDDEIDELISHIDVNKLINSWIYKNYKDGVRLVKLQNSMFQIKNNYIGMIGQLLVSDLKNVKYELIETAERKKGFKNMLVIDDSDLSYYIEIHMSDVYAEILERKYGLVKSKVRTTAHASAAAIYNRYKEEMDELTDALINGGVSSEGIERAKVISRAKSKDFDSSINGNNSSYTFVTEEIMRGSELFESFLSKMEGYEGVIEQNQAILHNGDYPIEMNINNICDNYYKIFNSFDENSKRMFIIYASNELQKGDDFDRALIQNHFIRGLTNVDRLGKIFIYSNLLKYGYLDDREKYMNANDYIDKLIRNGFVIDFGSEVLGYGRRL